MMVYEAHGRTAPHRALFRQMDWTWDAAEGCWWIEQEALDGIHDKRLTRIQALAQVRVQLVARISPTLNDDADPDLMI